MEKTISTRRKCPKRHEIVKIIKFEGNKASSYRLYCPKCNKFYTDAEVPRPSKKTDKLNGIVPQNIPDLVQKYANTSKGSLRKTLKKEIIKSKDTEIDVQIDKLLLTAKGARRDRLLDVAIQRQPEKYLKDYYEQYVSNDQELREKFKNINFNKGNFLKAAISLEGKITPYPKIILSRLGANDRMQYLIRAEVENGICPKYYVDYLSANWDIILEPWIQEKVYEFVVNENEIEASRYLDLNARLGYQYLNGIDDLAIVYHILSKNIWGVDETGLNLAKQDVLLAYKIKEGMELSNDEYRSLEKYINDIQLGSLFERKRHQINNYVEIVAGLVIKANKIEIAETYCRFLYEHQIKCGHIENYLASKKSILQYDHWIKDIHKGDLTQKHALSKQELRYYPEKAHDLLREIEKENDEILSRNVYDMIEKLGIDIQVITNSQETDSKDNEEVMVELLEQSSKDEKNVAVKKHDSFDDWSYEDTEDELFKDFIQKK